MDISVLDSSKNEMQNVKQRFFALRNGMLADMLRQGGSPYRIIFGLNLPQLREIAAVFGANDALADALWANRSTRESRLLAPMVADVNVFSRERALTWLGDLTGALEEVDILCHSLLRKTPYVKTLISELVDSENALMRYAALRLAFSFVNEDAPGTLAMAEAELSRGDALTQGVARQLKDEAMFVIGN